MTGLFVIFGIAYFGAVGIKIYESLNGVISPDMCRTVKRQAKELGIEISNSPCVQYF